MVIVVKNNGHSILFSKRFRKKVRGKEIFPKIGNVSSPLSMEALGHAVGGDENGPAALDARRR
jgi:hypothetical protein